MLRRSVLAGVGSLAFPVAAQSDPFPLGIASGSPRPTSVVLWTRVRPSDRAVTWAIAEDEGMQRVVRSGNVEAEARWAHTVHVDVDGLRPGRPYWYRFTVAGAASPVGRTRTAPDPREKVAQLRFAFASCQQYEQGYFSAHRHMAAEGLNAVLFVGDYIYELSWGRELVRRHGTGRPTELYEFRDRYALYKSDRDLQAAHAAHPWIVTWDDHEVTDDYTNDVSPADPDPARFLKQRAAAYQAFWEHMPLPNSMRPQGLSLRLYDRYRFGDLAELQVLDDRQYRSHHACRATLTRGKLLTGCDERIDPSRTMLGAEQEAWFADGMKRASARWNVVAQQTLMAEVDRGQDGQHSWWADGWDGYPAARQRLLDAVAASPVRDTLVLGGDVHSFWAADLARERAVVATEFVGGSITSQGPAENGVKARLSRNPHLRYGRTGVNGYGIVALDPKGAQVTFRTVSSVKQSETTIDTLARFAVEAGRPGVQRA
jgi:alkaline phosphatase D